MILWHHILLALWGLPALCALPAVRGTALQLLPERRSLLSSTYPGATLWPAACKRSECLSWWLPWSVRASHSVTQVQSVCQTRMFIICHLLSQLRRIISCSSSSSSLRLHHKHWLHSNEPTRRQARVSTFLIWQKDANKSHRCAASETQGSPILTLCIEQPLLRCLLPAAACAALARSFGRPGYLGATNLSCCSSKKASTNR